MSVSVVREPECEARGVRKGFLTKENIKERGSEGEKGHDWNACSYSPCVAA